MIVYSGEEDRRNGNDQYDFTDPNIVRDDEVDDDEYFKILENNNSNSRDKARNKKGIALSRKKNSSNKSKNNSKSKRDNDRKTVKQQKQHSKKFSKEYIDSGDLLCQN